MAESLFGELKPATDLDVAVAARKPIAAKDTGAIATNPVAPAPPVNPPATTSTDTTVPVNTPKKEGAEVAKAPLDTTSPVEKLKGRPKKPVETFIKKDAAPVEFNATDIPTEYKTKFDTYEKEITDLKGIVNDPDIQILLEAKKSKKDLFAILKDVEGINPDALTKEELYKIDCQQRGLGGDELEEALLDFEDLKSYEKTARTNTIRAELKSNVEAKKKDFLSKLREGNAQGDVQRQQQEQLYDKTKNEYLKLCDDYIGKNHYGITGTPQMAESLKNILQSQDGLIGKNQDGSLNASDLFEAAHYKLFKNLLFDELKNSAYTEAYEELEKEFGATGGSVSMVRMPQTAEKVTDQERGRSLLGNAVPVR